MDRRILITTAGSGAGYYAVSAAHAMGNFNIIAGDVYSANLIPASVIADQFVKIPYASDENYPAFILDLIRSLGIRYWVPILDEEIICASALRLTLDEMGCEVHAPGSEVAELCFDKLAMSLWLTEHRFPTPETRDSKAAVWRQGGWFAKPRWGRGSVGARLIANKEEFCRICGEADKTVFQEPCEPPEVTVDAFATRTSGDVYSICRERLETKAGVCTKARAFQDSQLVELAKRLSLELGLRGVFCFQAMRSPSNAGWLITDINPRPGAGTAMSAAIGFDPMKACLAEMLEIEFTPYLHMPIQPRFIMRTYCEHVTA
jgi:carbamoylphosphate synthase large subunit